MYSNHGSLYAFEIIALRQHLYSFAIGMCNELRPLLNYDFPIESIKQQINNE